MAEQLVTATEQQYGAKDRALVNPLANVGTTQLRLGNFAAAENAYTRALTILDSTATTTDRARLRPLQGLGLSYARSDQPAPAADTLRRAVDLSRNLDGLYNLGQVDFVRALISVYVAQGRLDESDARTPLGDSNVLEARRAEDAGGEDETPSGAGDPV